MALSPQELGIVITILQANFVSSCARVSCVALWTFDWLETLPSEISLVWAQKFTSVNALFYGLRYTPAILYIFCSVLERPYYAYNVSRCRNYLVLCSALTVLVIVLSQALLCIRVYAIGERLRFLKYYLTFHYAATVAIIVALISKHLSTLVYGHPPAGFEALRCTYILLDWSYLAALWAVVLFNEALMMTLSLVFIYRKHARGNPMLDVFYRNGTLYLGALVAASMANIIFSASTPHHEKYLFATIQLTLHSIFSTRMILQIRSVGNVSNSDPSSTNVGTSIEFQPRPTQVTQSTKSTTTT